jgi:3-deoxy-D-manno-octulosonic-acid transferase
MRFLYNILMYLTTPLVLLRLRWRARKAPAYKERWAERFAHFSIPQSQQGGIWIHAVSVGEVLLAVSLINALRQTHPELPLVLTCTTPTGSQCIKTKLSDGVFHVYAPYDLSGCVRRFLRKTKPRLAIFIETELWPNMLHQCRRQQIPTLLANARLSAQSAARYGYPIIRKLSQQMMQNLSCIAAKARADATRFKQLGACDNRVHVTGSIKFDMHMPDNAGELAADLRQKLGADRLTWIAASTHDGEDEAVLRAHQTVCQQYPNSVLILVPRHPERFNTVAALSEKLGFSTTRRSHNEQPNQQTQVYLGDTMGELPILCAAADVAFVGGSLVATGGHNTLEPAAFGVPVLSGPHTFNFAAITVLLQNAHALTIVNDAEALADAVIALFQDPEKRHQQGQAGQQVVAANRGALDKQLALIENLIKKERP